MEGPQLQPSGGWLPLGDSGGGRFDAVIDGVAQQMGERIADGFDQRPIEFRVGPIDHQLHLFPAGHGQIAHDPRKLAEHLIDRLHPRLHRRGLQRGGHRIDPMDHLEQFRLAICRR